MAYIPNYTYDIFISYSHKDNEVIFDGDAHWVEQFQEHLYRATVRMLDKGEALKIWWDKREVDEGVFFNAAIQDGIRHSAIIVSLISPDYLISNYCLFELEAFHTKCLREPYGLSVGHRSRLCNVLLSPIDHTNWPQELWGTTAYRFFHEEGSERVKGKTFAVKSEEYKLAICKLAEDLAEIITNFPDQQPPAQTEEKKFTIYFGEVADSIRRDRKRLIADLKSKDYNIIIGIPPPFESDKHKKMVRHTLEKADMHIHLLDEVEGREIEDDEDSTYPQEQVELSLEFEKSGLIWLSGDVMVDAIESDKYKRFLNNLNSGKLLPPHITFTRDSKSNLAGLVTEMAEQIISRDKNNLVNTLRVLLETHRNDQFEAIDLFKYLSGFYETEMNAEVGNPITNMRILEEKIARAESLVFYFGKVSVHWITERIKAAKQYMLTSDFPPKKLIIYLMPPEKDIQEILDELGIIRVKIFDNSHSETLLPELLAELIKYINHRK